SGSWKGPPSSRKAIAKSEAGPDAGRFRPEELARCQVLSRHFARVARGSFHVRRMRSLFLGGETATLTPEQAFLLLGSPAPRFLGPRYFEGHGIPLIGHRSKVLRWHPHLDEEAMTLSQDVELRLDWPGG